MHLNKEDAHLYRIFKERVSVPEQGKAIGIMASKIPQGRFSEVVAWLFPLVGLDDRETMVHIYQMMMPEPVFASTKSPSAATGPNSRSASRRYSPPLLVSEGYGISWVQVCIV